MGACSPPANRIPDGVDCAKITVPSGPRHSALTRHRVRLLSQAPRAAARGARRDVKVVNEGVLGAGIAARLSRWRPTIVDDGTPLARPSEASRRPSAPGPPPGRKSTARLISSEIPTIEPFRPSPASTPSDGVENEGTRSGSALSHWWIPRHLPHGSAETRRAQADNAVPSSTSREVFCS